MRINVTEKEIRQFKEGHGIEFDHPFSDQEITTLLDIGKKEAQWKSSRNLFLRYPQVQKIFLKRSLLSVFTALNHQKSFRIAFDQLLFPAPDVAPLPSLFKSPHPFGSQFCFQSLRCGAILCLEPIEIEAELPFTQSPHSLYFFPVEKLISFEPLIRARQGLYLLIGYGSNDLIYREEPNDPFQHELKRKGLAFGDKVPNSLSPLVFA
ncbi:MAG: hypothetical protein K9M07_04485 [Simkaniaceae bacterium]|nr:hypothetical protein [Simkaniaceae bacterium]